MLGPKRVVTRRVRKHLHHGERVEVASAISDANAAAQLLVSPTNCWIVLTDQRVLLAENGATGVLVLAEWPRYGIDLADEGGLLRCRFADGLEILLDVRGGDPAGAWGNATSSAA